eukprot:9296245-Pyramimonas_sp.AAC.1
MGGAEAAAGHTAARRYLAKLVGRQLQSGQREQVALAAFLHALAEQRARRAAADAAGGAQVPRRGAFSPLLPALVGPSCQISSWRRASGGLVPRAPCGAPSPAQPRAPARRPRRTATASKRRGFPGSAGSRGRGVGRSSRRRSPR